MVICSVKKQAAYHLQRKVPCVKYLYEVHELSYYPGQSSDVQQEREMLSCADLITVTTEPLKQILKNPPYSLTNPIEVVPLAVRVDPLPPPVFSGQLLLAYVGQLYEGQGLPLLLKALAQVEDVHLKVVGGNSGDIASLKKLSQELGLVKRVTFLGFVPPKQIPNMLHDVHAFVAPFENRGRMPYVAHTKLFEYAHWGRPIIAPDLPIVREHFSTGSLLYEPDNISTLAASIRTLQNAQTRNTLQEEISAYQDRFSWAERAKAYSHLLSSV